MLAVVAVSSVAVTRQFALARRLTELNQEGVALLNRDEADAAAAIFDDCIAKSGSLAEHRRLFEMNRAAAHLQQSQPARALALTQALLDRRAWEGGILSVVRGNLVAVHATACALSGRLTEAQGVLDEHAPELSDAQRSVLLSARALVSARGGHYDVAAAALREGWAAAEGVLPPRSMRALHALSAFAAHELGGDAGCRRHLASIAERPAQDFAYLAATWPDFAEFIAGRESYREAAR